MTVKQKVFTFLASLTLLAAVATGNMATTVDPTVNGQAIACHSSSTGGGGC